MRAAAVLIFLGALSLGPSASADTFSGGGGGFSGSGSLNTIGNGDGSYTITGLAGSGFGTLFAPGGYQQNDNQLFPGATDLVDGHGFAFSYTQGDTGYDVDILSSGSGTYAADFTDLDSNLLSSLAVTFSLTGPSQRAVVFHANPGRVAASFDFSFGAVSAVTPEPSALLLLGTGALGVAGVLRRRRGRF